jgi:hypothetical protein
MPLYVIFPGNGLTREALDGTQVGRQSEHPMHEGDLPTAMPNRRNEPSLDSRMARSEYRQLLPALQFKSKAKDF